MTQIVQLPSPAERRRAKNSLELPVELEEMKRRRRPRQPVPLALREHALYLVASGVGPCEVARLVGATPESLRKWRRAAEAEGLPEASRDVTPTSARSSSVESAETPSSVPNEAETTPGDDAADRALVASPPGGVPALGGAGRASAPLAPTEVEAILSLKKRHPSMGPAQIRAQLRRFKGWRLAVKAIGRVLKENGYELVHRGSRPQGQEEPARFEAPWRNALWQLDFVELRVGGERAPLLLVLDDFSRFVVEHAVLLEPTSEAVVAVVTEAIRRHGKPEAVYTDRGGPFIAWHKPSSFGRFLEAELIDHYVSPAYRPQGRGKVEALAHTVRRELWDLVEFGSVAEARAGLQEFFEEYNYRRAHMGIDGLTPADRFFGRWEEVRAKVEAVVRRRLCASVLANAHDPVVSEELPGASGALEALRLVVVDGGLELRLFGQRVVLGGLRS